MKGRGAFYERHPSKVAISLDPLLSLSRSMRCPWRPDSVADSDGSGELLQSDHDSAGCEAVSDSGSLLDSEDEPPARHRQAALPPASTSKIEVEALVKSWSVKFEAVVAAIEETMKEIDSQLDDVPIGSTCAGSGMAEIVPETCKRVWKSNGMNGASKEQEAS